MTNETKQLTVVDLEAAKTEFSSIVKELGDHLLSKYENIAATCIRIVEELVKSGNGCKYASEQASNLWVIYEKAVAAFGGEVK